MSLGWFGRFESQTGSRPITGSSSITFMFVTGTILATIIININIIIIIIIIIIFIIIIIICCYYWHPWNSYIIIFLGIATSIHPWN